MKVLIVSHNCFSKIYNNGKTLESIFGSFSKENLAQVYFTENMHPDFDFCDNYFKLTDIDVLKSLLKGSVDTGRIVNADVAGENASFSSKGSGLFWFAKSKIDHIVLFRDILWSFNTWKSKSFLKWIEKYNPDVIFYVGGNFGFSHKIASFLSKKQEVPLVTYFTDDYLIYPKSKNLLDKIQKKRMVKFYNKTIKQSSLLFAIGEVMADEYSSYFDKMFYSVMNSVSLQEYSVYHEKENITLSYFGGLHLNRWQMLVKLAKSLSSGTIQVYSVDKPSQEILYEFDKVDIIFKGSVEGKNLREAILDSDVLLHVESDDLYNRTLTKLSVSTKIPEYLMSGRAILGFGPVEVASMKILSDNNIGLVISSELSEECLRIELDKITSNFEIRKEVGKLGYDYAVMNFDNKKIAEKFKKKIENLIIDYGN